MKKVAKKLTKNLRVFAERVKQLKPKHNSYVLYRGPSMLNGEPIVVIATGLKKPSDNDKTGPMAQVWIFTDNGISPSWNFRLALDKAVCGTVQCVHRLLGTCYVDLPKSADSPFGKLLRGTHGVYTTPEIFRGYEVRFGAYGDPAAMPLSLIEEIAAVSRRWTGYTHQWSDPRVQPYRKYLQASCDLSMDRRYAKRLGWFTYRVEFLGDDPTADPALDAELPKEVMCPGQKGGKLDADGEAIQCMTCLLCHGDSEGVHEKQNRCDVLVRAHGIEGAKTTFTQVWAAKQSTAEVLTLVA